MVFADAKDPIQTATLDSTLENPEQKESDNRDWEEDVRRRADRRCVGWLCRRGDRRLRACWPGDPGARTERDRCLAEFGARPAVRLARGDDDARGAADARPADARASPGLGDRRQRASSR